jgi:hypothetical protein
LSTDKLVFDAAVDAVDAVDAAVVVVVVVRWKDEARQDETR